MLLDQLSKHRCMGNVMKISLPFPKGVFYVISRHEYHALLALGKDIPLKYEFKHIFLSINLFNLPCDPYDLSSNVLQLL